MILGTPTYLSAQDPEQALSPEEFWELRASLLKNPGALTWQTEALKKISPRQMARLIYAMDLSHHTFLYPVRVKGEKLTALLGRELSQLSVMAVWDGKLQTIPFQIEEYDRKSGYVYIESVNPFPIEGTHLHLDGGDELAFMYRDTGIERFRRSQHTIPDSVTLEKELIFEDLIGRKRYAYIVSGNPERSELDYIHTSLENATMSTSYYQMAYDPDNFLSIRDFRPLMGKGYGQRIVDFIYFQMSAHVFTRFFKVNLDSQDNIRIKVLGVKDGPVRSVLFLKISVVVAGIPVFSMYSEMNAYEQGLVMPNRTEPGKGALLTRIFKNPEMLIYLDMNGLNGGKVSADAFTKANGELAYGNIDGKMDDVEQGTNNLQNPGDWIWLQSGLGWDVFMSLAFPEDKFHGMETFIYYLDDATHQEKGEAFEGAGPHLGMRVVGLPKDIKKLEGLDLEYAFWYPDSAGRRGPKDFYRHLSNPPTLKIRELSP